VLLVGICAALGAGVMAIARARRAGRRSLEPAVATAVACAPQP
jgi:hypothetical protein